MPDEAEVEAMRWTDRRLCRKREHQWLRDMRARDHALLDVWRVPRRLEAGRVVWAHVPFVERSGEKLRPVVVADASGELLAVRRITSSVTRLRYDFYVEIEDLDAVGLDRPCGIEVRRTIDIARLDVVSSAGRLSPADDLRVEVGACLWSLANDVSSTRVLSSA
ncbi:MAG: hypothetical protein R2726_20460 [Acidimicrobiales bacterium]